MSEKTIVDLVKELAEHIGFVSEDQDKFALKFETNQELIDTTDSLKNKITILENRIKTLEGLI